MFNTNFVFIFFSLAGTKLHHYVVYGYVPLFILMAQAASEIKYPAAHLVWPAGFLLLLFFLPEIAGRLQDSSTRLILDTSGEPFNKALKAGGIYLAKPNLNELEEFSGRTLDSEAEQEKVCAELIDSGACEAIALSLGAEGALLVAPGIRKRIDAIPTKVVSGVGAGDSFVAGMNLALYRGQSLEEAFLYGMAAATAALVTPGTELCKLDDTNAYYQQLLERHPLGE